jgi:hypothetical protein
MVTLEFEHQDQYFIMHMRYGLENVLYCRSSKFGDVRIMSNF